ncbi:capsule polysaccharide biosynthesis [Desulfoluna spongiiphila]|nr:capsule polysaccharide biosynthesis [Desulfoluna spongiiphila]
MICASRKMSCLAEIQGTSGNRLRWVPFACVLARLGILRNVRIAGWGMKPMGARGIMQRRGSCSYTAFEDGFYAWIGHPALGGRRLGLVVDEAGIYYDSRSPSDLEHLLNHPHWLTEEMLQRAGRLIKTIVQAGISKYNHQAERSDDELECLLPKGAERVLVVDQTVGDMSVEGGRADASTFDAMLDAALEENPNAEVCLKVHPDVLVGKKRGYLGGRDYSGRGRIRVFSDSVRPVKLIERCSKVYTVSSQIGFESLMVGKPVVCFGIPFYSGWGLTDDRKECGRRIQTHSIESLFAAACLKYSHYYNPETGTSCELEDVLSLAKCQKKYQAVAAETCYVVGFSLWKRAFVGRFLGDSVQKIRYVKTLEKALDLASPRDAVLLWGVKDRISVLKNPMNIPIWRMEDGFIRSVGLGSDFRRPWSLVLDTQGIYFDPSQPSDLENILQTHRFTKRDLERSTRLIQRLQSQRISKYNDGAAHNVVFSGSVKGRKVILVPGQVEDDASIRLGCVDIRSNLALLREVRRTNPCAWIVYKPHPDVMAGNRKGRAESNSVRNYADEVVYNVNIYDCIDKVDEIHTMTSLAGFEALLMNKKVFCYGVPFYSGWGLTKDRHNCQRRTRVLALEELVFGVLHLYPRYVHWYSGCFSTPEAVIDALLIQREQFSEEIKGVREPIFKKIRKLRFLFEALRDLSWLRVLLL